MEGKEDKEENRAQELWESRGGRPGLPVPNNPYGLCGRKTTLNCSLSDLRSCGKVEVDVLGSTSLIVIMVSVDVKQHLKKKKTHTSELWSCVKIEVYVLIVRTVTVDVQQHLKFEPRAQELCESRGGTT